MKYWMLVLIPILALSIGCGKPYVMGTPIGKAKLKQIVPGTATDAKVIEVFGEPFKKETVTGETTKYTYTYYSEQPRIFTEDKVTKQILEVYTKGGMIQKYYLKSEGIADVSEAGK
jgi:SmpA / OmlA family